MNDMDEGFCIPTCVQIGRGDYDGQDLVILQLTVVVVGGDGTEQEAVIALLPEDANKIAVGLLAETNEENSGN
jgi:hypothetical protein